MVRAAVLLVLGLGALTWLVILATLLWLSRGVNRAITRAFGR